MFLKKKLIFHVKLSVLYHDNTTVQQSLKLFKLSSTLSKNI
jgi:hypothetical protein